MRKLAIVIAVVGILALIAAIIYFAVPTGSLPSFLPGHVAHVAGHRTRHGIAAAVVGVVLLIAAWMVAQREQPAAA